MLRRWDDPTNPPWDGGAFWDEDVVEAGNKRKISDHPGDTDWMCGPVNGVSVYILQIGHCPLSFFSGPAEHDQIIRIAHHLPAPLDHLVVQRIEIQVR